MERGDPLAPLRERTPEQVADYLDSHLIMALNAADHLHHGDRQEAEDYVRNRLVALSDSWPEPLALEAEDSRRRMNRLARSIGLKP